MAKDYTDENLLPVEPLEEEDANNSSSFADFNNRTKMGSQGTMPDGLANIIAEIARECIQGLGHKISILEASLVKRLSEAALCVKKAIAALANKRAPNTVEIRKNNKDKGRSI